MSEMPERSNRLPETAAAARPGPLPAMVARLCLLSLTAAGLIGLACATRETPPSEVREVPGPSAREAKAVTAPAPAAPAPRAPEVVEAPETTAAAEAPEPPPAETEPPARRPAEPAKPRRTGPVRVLVLTGRNNHKWRETTPVLVRLYEASPRFVVSVTDDPASLDAADFAECDVVVSNWCAFPKVNDRDWGEHTERAFLDFIERGGGFALFHAASATFNSWPEYQNLIGATWGKGTGHGPFHAFKVTAADAEHPVTRGMSSFWTADELWHRMSTKPQAITLCTAFSDPKQRGTGRDEPVVFCTHYGEGRSFYLVLGHDARAMRNPGWRALMLRGTEWAATGEVTVPFPNHLPATRAAAEALLADVDQVLAAVRPYERGASRKAVLKAQELVHLASTDPALRRDVARRLAQLVTSDAAGGAKERYCELLSIVGGRGEVPALAGLLGGDDDKLALAARGALERIPGEESLRALRSALHRVKGAKGEALVGIINTLGERRDTGAVAAIARHLTGGDAAAAGAAVDALGKIGGAASAKALSAAERALPAKLRPALGDALIRCAEGLVAAGEPEEAAAVFEKMSRPGRPKHVRIAAFPGLVACRKGRAADLVLKALAGDDLDMQLAAVRAVRTVPGAGMTRALAAKLPTLPPEVRAGVIDALAERGDRAGVPAIAAEVSCKDARVRRSAIAALGRLGDASSVMPLVRLVAGLATGARGTEQRAARSALARIKGAGVEEAMTRGLRDADVKVRREIVIALAARGARSAVPALLKVAEAARHADAGVRKEAVKAVGALADESACPKLVALLASRGTDAERRDVENALVSICGRSGRGAGPVLAGLRGRGASAKVRLSLLRVLGKLGGRDALAAVREALKDGDPEVRKAAVRALAEWPSPEPLADLLAAARAAPDTVTKVLALRGFARLSAKADALPAAELAALYDEAMKLAGRADEKKALLSGLANVRSEAALRVAAACLADPALRNEAGLAAVEIAGALAGTGGKARASLVRSTLRDVLAQRPSGSVRAKATEIMMVVDKPRNLARGAKATSPDGLEKDGDARGDMAAIDGNPGTYWDEVDRRKLYKLRVTFDAPTEVSAISILGFQHHSYAPKDFEIVCDDKVAKRVRNAVYRNNKLAVTFEATRCTWLELRITGYYGASPAIRELEIYSLGQAGGAGPEKGTGAKKGTDVPAKPSYGWQRAETSVALLNNGRVVWKLNHDRKEDKPYFHPLGLSDGTELTWLRPPDHPWHRALWFSWKFVGKPGTPRLNYWEEDRRTGLSQGRTEIVSVEAATREEGSARIEMALAYHPPGKPPVLTEKRLVTVSAPDAKGGYGIDWRADFAAGAADVLLDRTPIRGEKGGKGYGGYAGLSLRLAKSTRGWAFVDSEGRRDEKAHGKRARWMAFAGTTASGKDAAIVVLDHPANLRHPTPWYVAKGMPYFGPALLFAKPYTLAAGRGFTLRYRVLVRPGRFHAGEVEKEWKAFGAVRE